MACYISQLKSTFSFSMTSGGLLGKGTNVNTRVSKPLHLLMIGGSIAEVLFRYARIAGSTNWTLTLEK